MLRQRVLKSIYTNIFIKPLLVLFGLVGSAFVARILGAELLATVGVIRALSTTLGVLSEMGLNRSLIRIIPDISISKGGNSSIRMAEKFRNVRVAMVTILAGLFVVFGFDKLEAYSPALSISLGYVLAILMVYVTTQKYVLMASLKNYEIAKVDIVSAAIMPVFNVTFALAWGSPLLVVVSIIIVQGITVYLLNRIKYDLDMLAGVTHVDDLKKVILEYWKYISTNYIVSIFNRLLVRPAFIIWILIFFSISAQDIGNTVVAMTIIYICWDIAILPTSQLRGVLLARFYAGSEEGRVVKLEKISAAAVAISSSILAITVNILGFDVLLALYGDAYSEGIQWGVNIATFALLGTAFSLGNSLLLQLDKFRYIFSAIIAGTLFMVTALVGLYGYSEGIKNIAPYVVFIVILTRIIFWLYTDVAAMRKSPHLGNMGIKIKAIFATIVVIYAGSMIDIDGYAQTFMLYVGCILAFYIIIISMGGIGDERRKILSDIVSSKYHWILRAI